MMNLIITHTANWQTHSSANLRFYDFIETAKNFGVNIKRAFGSYDCVIIFDEADLTRRRYFAGTNTYLVQIDEKKYLDKKILFFDPDDDESLFRFASSDFIDVGGLQKSIDKYLSEDTPSYSNLSDVFVEADFKDEHLSLINSNAGTLHICRFKNIEIAEEALIYDLIETFYIENKEFQSDTGSKDALPTIQQRFTLGHYIDPNHPSLLSLQNLYSHLTCEDLSIDKLGEKNFYDAVFKRVIQFLPNLERHEFDERPASAISACIQHFLLNNVKAFPDNPKIGKTDFLLPLDFFDYLEVDSLSLSEQMTADVYEALGPARSGFEAD